MPEIAWWQSPREPTVTLCSTSRSSTTSAAQACESILQAAKLLQAKHGKLTICSAAGSVKTVLETAGFEFLLDTYATEKEAVAAFST